MQTGLCSHRGECILHCTRYETLYGNNDWNGMKTVHLHISPPQKAVLVLKCWNERLWLKTFGKQWGVTVSCNVAMLILSGVSGQHFKKTLCRTMRRSHTQDCKELRHTWWSWDEVKEWKTHCKWKKRVRANRNSSVCVKLELLCFL